MKNQAFTLIELLVVVLIIGILAAIAVPKYQVAVLKTQYYSLKPIAASIAQAENEYFLQHSTYTTNFSDLSINVGTETEIANRIYLNNGHCSLENTNVYCSNDNSTGDSIIGFQIFYPYTTHPYVGKIKCVAVNDTARKVCQQDTGLEVETKSFTGYTEWIYQ